MFALSITPRLYLHHAMADHEDEDSSCKHPEAATCLHQQKIKCHVDDLVVNTPYVTVEHSLSLGAANIYKELASVLPCIILVSTSLNKESRGPPAASSFRS